jgi:hypothetical protein
MEQGYIKLWRKSLESGLLRNHKVWVFWTWCLLKATHKEHTAVIGYQQVLLQPGQFVFGRRKAAKETGLSEREVRTSIVLLGKWKNLTIKTTNKFSIITLVNWAHYQSEPMETTSKTTSRRPAGDHIQECKEWKECKEQYSAKLSDKESLSAYLESLPEYKTLSSTCKTNILEFINKVRQGNKTKTLAPSRAAKLISSLMAILGKYGADHTVSGINAVFSKEKRDGFSYGQQDPTGYVRAVAKSRYSKAAQAAAEQQAQHEREAIKKAPGTSVLMNEIADRYGKA